MDISNAINITLDANKINVDGIFRERFKSLVVYHQSSTAEELRTAWKAYKANLIDNIEQMEL
jgi:hypothetical protein